MTKFRWVIRYTDGTSSDSDSINYENINRSNLTSFLFYLRSKPKLKLILNPNRKLFFRKRTGMGIDNIKQYEVFILGYHEKDGDTLIKRIAFVFSGGKIEFKDDWDNSNVIFSEINLREEEKE